MPSSQTRSRTPCEAENLEFGCGRLSETPGRGSYEELRTKHEAVYVAGGAAQNAARAAQVISIHYSGLGETC
jgi:hypothetical protein